MVGSNALKKAKISQSPGFPDRDRAELKQQGIGITPLVESYHLFSPLHAFDGESPGGADA